MRMGRMGLWQGEAMEVDCDDLFEGVCDECGGRLDDASQLGFTRRRSGKPNRLVCGACMERDDVRNSLRGQLL